VYEPWRLADRHRFMEYSLTKPRLASGYLPDACVGVAGGHSLAELGPRLLAQNGQALEPLIAAIGGSGSRRHGAVMGAGRCHVPSTT
jgi:hypothetical protein